MLPYVPAPDFKVNFPPAAMQVWYVHRYEPGFARKKRDVVIAEVHGQDALSSIVQGSELGGQRNGIRPVGQAYLKDALGYARAVAPTQR